MEIVGKYLFNDESTAATGVRKQVRYEYSIIYDVFVFRAYDNTYLQIHSFFRKIGRAHV